MWKWQFQIGKTVTTGKTQSNLMGMAARRVQQRIDRELGKPRDLTCGKSSKAQPQLPLIVQRSNGTPNTLDSTA